MILPILCFRISLMSFF
uniref:Uncharacterized protein n=1 Tax=Arundo donax TaxID=35708 RepID=A0A0A9BHG2_ARUDO